MAVDGAVASSHHLSEGGYARPVTPQSGPLRASGRAAVPTAVQDSSRGLLGNMAISKVTTAAAMTAPYAEVREAPKTAQPETSDLRTCTRLRKRNGTNTNG